MDERELFIESLKLDEEVDRTALLDRVCTDDPGLRSRVQRLLNAHLKAESFLETNLDGDDLIRSPLGEIEKPGTQIGPYKLLEVIGEGGMGTVYMAEQLAPVKRRVALKVIKAGMDTQQVIARFEVEKQSLAMMDHPNIAKVHDGGTTETGRPYFVMELVKGLPITEFCDKQKLSTDARLKLFRQVCQAVQHAHQKGIIHRDLKPSNIMIAMYDDQPVPKVIDFGVAKATSERLTENTFFTRFGEVVGTLTYMSPEQAQFNQLDIDTRSDIYSLGAILYELLVGEPPFDKERLKSLAFDETLRMIREEEPTKPSTKLSSAKHAAQIAFNRDTTSAKLGSKVNGELDWIVMKALDKDRTRRFETANEFAADINRYLANEPVSAGKPSAAYRFKKFAKRNKGKLAAGSVITALLLLVCAAFAYAIVNGWYQQRETQQALKAAKSGQERLEGLANLIITGLISEAKPNGIGNPEITVRDAMFALEKKLDSTLPDSPDVRAWVMGQLGGYLKDLGCYEESKSILTEAYRQMQETHGNRDKETLWVGRNLAWSLSHLDIHDKAVPLAREIAVLATQEYGDVVDVANCWNTLGVACYRANSLDQAELAFRRSIAINERLGQLDAASIGNLGDVYYERRDFENAEKHYLQFLEMHRNEDGENQFESMEVMDDLAYLYHAQGKTDQAKRMLQQSLEKKKPFMPRNHPEMLRTIDFLAQVEFRLGEKESALDLFEQFAEGNRLQFGESSMRYANALNSLAIGRRNVNDLQGAFEACDQAVKIATDQVGEQNSETMLFTFTLSSYLRDLRRWGDAQQCVAKVIAYRESETSDNPESLARLAGAYLFQGLLFRFQGQDEKALVPYNKAVELLNKQVKTDSHFRTLQYLCDTLRWRSTSLRHLGRFPESIADANKARALTDSLDEQLDCDLRRAQTMAEMGQYENATSVAEEVLNELDDEGYLLARAAAIYGICLNTFISDEVVEEMNDLYVDRALELLGQAAALGEFDAPFSILKIQENPDFAALQDHDEFNLFLATLTTTEKDTSDHPVDQSEPSANDQR